MRFLVVLFLVLPCLALAESSRATFDIYASGIRVGSVTVAGQERGGRYATAGRLETGGIVGAFRSVRYDAEVRGRHAGSSFRPESYSETFRNGGDVDRKSITWRAGVPSVTTDQEKEPDAEDLDPRTQGGTVDPLTAIWGVLRDVSPAEVCRFSADLFDGTRRSRVTLGRPRQSEGVITCAGEYRRIAGYTASDMARKSRFPFRVTYRPAPGGIWQVGRIEIDTLFGPGSLVRR